MELIKLPIIEERKIVQSGSSLVMSLPKAWLEENGLTAGEPVLIRANGNLEIMRKTKENIAKLNKEVEEVRNHLNHVPVGSHSKAKDCHDKNL